jgi:hypothetical protein
MPLLNGQFIRLRRSLISSGIRTWGNTGLSIRARTGRYKGYLDYPGKRGNRAA